MENFDSSLYNPIIIAIDGVSAAGKGTIVKGLKKVLDNRYHTLDAGLMYRAQTRFYIDKGISDEDLKHFEDLDSRLADEIKLSFDKNGNLLLNGTRMSDNDLRGPEIDPFVGKYAALDEIKKYTVDSQKKIVLENKNLGWILDGRCMGSAVAPQAQVKFFMKAPLLVRATRRHIQYVEAGKGDFSTEEISIDLQRRDDLDRNTRIAPLIQPKDAIEIDSFEYSPNGVVNRALDYVKRKIIEEGKLN